MSQLDLPPRYQELSELGRGGSGRVLLVRDTFLKKDVALKLLRKRPNASALEQLKREFDVLTRIDHPGIARAFDFGFVGDRPYFTAEYVPGAVLGRGELTVSDFVRHAHDIAAAVAFLHAGEILHLDIKPSNIVVPAEASRGPVLIDFGLHRRNSDVREPGVICGSLPYMAPEYFRGQALGPWTDVYSLGATLYRTLTGRYPRSLDEDGRIVWAPLPEPPSHLSAEIPREWDEILLRCLAMEPKARFPDGGALKHVFERMLEGPGREARRPRASPVSRTVGRQTELARALRFIDETLDGSSRAPVLVITGPPGAGLSHFLRDLKVEAQTRGLPFYLHTAYPASPPPPGTVLECLGFHLDREKQRTWKCFLQRLRQPRELNGKPEDTNATTRTRRAAILAEAIEAVQGPVLLGIDSLQHYDEVSVELVADLARLLNGSRSPTDASLALILAYREEGASAMALARLTESLLATRRSRVIGIPPLGVEDTLALHREWRELLGNPLDDAPRALGLALFQTTGGVPARIVAAAMQAPGESPCDDSPQNSAPASLSGEERSLLYFASASGRPAGVGELARWLGVSRFLAGRRVERLARAAWLYQDSEDERGTRWLATQAARELLSTAPSRVRRRVHRVIAEDLLRNSLSEDDPLLAEAFRHCRAGGLRSEILQHGPRLGRYLKATLQDRTALEVFSAVRESLPETSAPRTDGTAAHGGFADDPFARKIELSLEIATLQARLGELDAAVTLLRTQLGPAERAGGPWYVRVLLKLAMLYSRRGEFRRADDLLTDGLESGRNTLDQHEFLTFVNEQAALKVFVGEYDKALELCAEGLRFAGEIGDADCREIALNLYATRANVALRRFEFETARQDFHHSLKIADTMESIGNRAVILNNLGIVLNQCGRFDEALTTFREAETTCRQLDEGPSLTFIYGNLLVLHAKLGNEVDTQRVWNALDRIGGLSVHQSEAPSWIGHRERLFLAHHAGLSLLYRGRPDEALPHFDLALQLGQATGDREIVSFDLLYRADALLFAGSFSAAEAALEKLTDENVSRQVQYRGNSRRALLEALRGRSETVRRWVTRSNPTETEFEVPFLDAWDALYAGWALSIVGDDDGSNVQWTCAEEYFAEHHLRPALFLIRWLRAERAFLAGDDDTASTLLEASRSSDVVRSHGLLAALWPLLEARLLLSPAADESALERAADRLAEAGTALLENPLPLWSVRLIALREVIRRGKASESSWAACVDQLRHDDGASVSREDSEPLPEYWKTWCCPELPGSLEAVVAAPSDHCLEVPRRGSGTGSTRRTAPLSPRQGLVTRSPAMRSLAKILDRIRPLETALVIEGETGVGKEIVARVVHAESQRASKVFRVLDLATLPAALLEAELFGARAGAFSGAEEDRPGFIAESDGGTILIDGLVETPLEVQAKLLRVLDAGKYRSLGAVTERHVDIRLLFSTIRPLAEELEAGRIRPDLYHRLRSLCLRVPPLRDRREDFAKLVSLFVQDGGASPEVEDAAVERLTQRNWPGNVRELRNTILRLTVEHPNRILERHVDALTTSDALPSLLPPTVLDASPLGELKERVEREFLQHHLQRLRGHVQALSEFLGVTPKHCYRRLKQLGIPIERRSSGRP